MQSVPGQYFSLLTSAFSGSRSQLASRTYVSVFHSRVPSPDERASGTDLGVCWAATLCSSSTVSTTYEARRMLVRRNGTLATPPRTVCPGPSVPASASSQCLARLAAHAKPDDGQPSTRPDVSQLSSRVVDHQALQPSRLSRTRSSSKTDFGQSPRWRRGIESEEFGMCLLHTAVICRISGQQTSY